MFFRANRRFTVLYEYLGRESTGDILDEYLTYVLAMEADVQDIWRTIAHYVGLQHKIDPNRIHLRIDRQALEPAASVQKNGNDLIIKLSATFVMMIDQLTSLWAREAFPNFNTFGLDDKVTERSDFAYDFSYLFAEDTKSYFNERRVSPLTQFITFSDDPVFSNTLEMLANLTITWTILHEFYHIELGHLDEGHNKIDEANSIWDAESLEFELEADAFATITLFAIVHRADFAETYLSHKPEHLSANWFQYLHFCCLQSTSIMHKLNLVPPTGQTTPTEMHRIISLRLHNILRSAIRALPDIELAQRGMGSYKGSELSLEVSETNLICQVGKNLNNIDWLCRTLRVGPLYGPANLEVIQKPNRLVPFEITVTDQLGADYLEHILEHIQVLFGLRNEAQPYLEMSSIEKLGGDWALLIHICGNRLIERTNWSMPNTMNFIDAMFYIYAELLRSITGEIEQRAFGRATYLHDFEEKVARDLLLKIPEFALMARDTDRESVKTRDGEEISIFGDGGARAFIP